MMFSQGGFCIWCLRYQTAATFDGVVKRRQNLTGWSNDGKIAQASSAFGVATTTAADVQGYLTHKKHPPPRTLQ